MLLVNEKGFPESVGIHEVLYINQTKKGPEFVTRRGVYRYPLTMEQLCGVFQPLGFEQLDRNAVVNLDNVQRYDDKLRAVYFESETAEDGKLYATVSLTHAAKVRHLIREGEIGDKHEGFMLYKLTPHLGIGII